MSTSCTANEAEVDTHVRLALDGEDANIIVDLRELNKGRQGKSYLENVTEVAVQERKHGELLTLHLLCHHVICLRKFQNVALKVLPYHLRLGYNISFGPQIHLNYLPHSTLGD